MDWTARIVFGLVKSFYIIFTLFPSPTAHIIGNGCIGSRQRRLGFAQGHSMMEADGSTAKIRGYHRREFLPMKQKIRPYNTDSVCTPLKKMCMPSNALRTVCAQLKRNQFIMVILQESTLSMISYLSNSKFYSKNYELKMKKEFVGGQG